MPKALINGEVLRWARERAAMPPEELASKVGQKPDRLAEWEEGKDQPTFKQAQRLASLTHVPFGYLFLPSPPDDSLPIPDLRTIGTAPAPPLDANTRDLLLDIQFKHGWFKEFLVAQGSEPLPFVGKYTDNADAKIVAADIRATLDLDQASRSTRNWETYARLLIDRAEVASIWVMRSGIVGNNTHRPLNVKQFRGFAISDPIAPLIFINGRDALAAQIFTFAHELAHLWLGSSGISNVWIGSRDYGTSRTTEIACNAIAAEVLVPSDQFNRSWQTAQSLSENADRLSQAFKVSRVVIARRALDQGLISNEAYDGFYSSEEARWIEERRPDADDDSGGNFYNTLPIRNGSRFTRAVVSQAASGQLLLRQAGSLLNMQPASIIKFFKQAARND